MTKKYYLECPTIQQPSAPYANSHPIIYDTMKEVERGLKAWNATCGYENKCFISIKEKIIYFK